MAAAKPASSSRSVSRSQSVASSESYYQAAAEPEAVSVPKAMAQAQAQAEAVAEAMLVIVCECCDAILGMIADTARPPIEMRCPHCGYAFMLYQTPRWNFDYPQWAVPACDKEVIEKNPKPDQNQGGIRMEITTGCGIGWYQQLGCIVINNPLGQRMFWPNGDDKKSVSLIKDENDFFAFAEIIAEINGMKIVEAKRFHYGPMFFLG